ncbi:hypothetical protein BCD64_20465 [Nostoc sp. MBR 210]|uniref:SxtJ n=1 Tax=Nostoc spongiaeforme FACHB-130 TaxID=1357510 RepID=A0ABR8FRE8_9NOSO|nr:hypothetical protein [Nostoc spongiaeforme]MBD2592768.1 hypothetical protein [Nostoc spongiaeforme FACHB-130]OCQ94845.1 hypothetical protein BCD64_20465 [Nostoc sp. MBR 210]
MNQSSLNRWLTQVFGMLLGIGITIWILRGFRILTFLPGGIIWLFILGAIAVAMINFAQRTWWRF